MDSMLLIGSGNGWHNLAAIQNRVFVCGYCGRQVSSDKGFKLGEKQSGSGGQVGGLYICPNCQGPTFFTVHDDQLPGGPVGGNVDGVPEDLTDLYNEARRCAGQNCPTAAVMLCRKMLMSIAVDLGAAEGKRFIDYVEYLSDRGHVPPQGKGWVDYIRKKGNEANHEIRLMEDDTAEKLIRFTEGLLRFVYEFPSLVPDPEAEE